METLGRWTLSFKFSCMMVGRTLVKGVKNGRIKKNISNRKRKKTAME